MAESSPHGSRRSPASQRLLILMHTVLVFLQEKANGAS